MNGDHTIELEVHQQKNNALDLNSISEMWTVTYKNVDYKIVYIDKITKGNSFYLKLRGKPLFYDEFSTSIIHYVNSGSMTPDNAFTKIFNGTNYQPVLTGNHEAKVWDGFGKGQTRLDLFKTALDKYQYEFEIVGNVVYLKDMIGNDTNFLYKYKLNATDVQKSIDATTLYTHIKGFGDFADGGAEDYLKNAKLQREYTSGLASIIGIREAPPIIDGRVKLASTLDSQMKATVDESLQITFTAKLYDLRKQGYPHGIPLLGDRTFLLDERINERVEIRVYGLEETYDEQDVLKKCDVTFGNRQIRKRYASKISNISKSVRDLLEGKLQLKFDVLDAMSKSMVKTIQSVTSDLYFDENGITAVDKNNPNLFMRLNSAGLFISEDGGLTGKTAITARGITADAITTGTMIANRIMGGMLRDFWGNFEWNLNTGQFYIGNSTLVYKNAGNAAVYGNNGYVAGTLFTVEKDTPYPSMVIGTSPNIGTESDPRMDPNSKDFAGVRAFSTPTGGNLVELIGDDVNFRNRSGDVSDESAGFKFLNGGVELVSYDSDFFRLRITDLNDMKVGNKSLMSSDGRNGIAFDGRGTDFVLVVDGKAYKVSDVINNANFS
ncbi:phage tail protein [Staphylococcus sp. IVB6238]|uniref:phage tail protein n=1 Tax=Staphylococcus sp. IVB6238 TaxID=2989770 RepID=UPI0021CF70DC|nr:phage tail protein [Staphylococcus sp. IVB6238]UXR73291.1 phage tail protein [Staphylococcus sp. IVB6238]